MGRLVQQLAVLEGSHMPLVQRSYEYDLVGNLIQTQDKRFGTTNYRYDKLGQIQLAGQELFQFDPAHNIIERESERIQNNQVTAYQGITYRYDEFGNLSQRTLPNGEVQSYRYNAKDKLVEVTIQKPNQAIETWQYQYDVLGRRISKRLENQENLQEFIWDGSHLVQEIDHKTNRTYCYIYSHPNSYEPLAQLVFAKNSKNPTACYYYHNDQIGVPRELTDENGKLCWYGDYTGWGKLKNEYALVENIHQPFRLQNQYADDETGLHYNFFRYYEPNIGRFTQLDPIGLAGGENLYRFAPNVNEWVDPLGLFEYVDEYGDSYYYNASFAGLKILNSEKKEFAYHGNWCGPGWTGGKHESYSKGNDNNGYYKNPVGLLDSACKAHDICYAQCRKEHPCGGVNKKSCMDKCDDGLVASANEIKSDTRGTPLTRSALSGIISLNLGGDSNPEASCRR
ncbi:RHS repeat domain-containing protein [Glaesserella parasuis]|uniref:RHS repeat domain-containing protein n=1 Tax=Glaesserella parasuis TaxID=738 RepID=UPI0024367A47|nr:RHS repeat-associated core domain-containing protein [Glaesserella parasuis]MDG6362472.1 RHS repeat-associated core domain-containing protein [Glaesserella parasuis]